MTASRRPPGAGILLLLVLSVSAAAQDEGETVHGAAVVAIVDGKPVTFGEVWERVRRVLEEARTQLSEEQFQEFARRHLTMGRQDLIGRMLLLAKAEEEGVKVTERQVEAYAEREMEILNRDYGANLVTLEDFWEARAEATGLSEKKYREELRARAVISQLLREHVWQPEYFSPDVVRSYFREHRQDFQAGGYVAVRHLYIRGEQPGYAEIVDQIKSAIVRGEDFEALARNAVEKGYSRRQGRDKAGRYHYRLHKGADGELRPEEIDGDVDDLIQPLPTLIHSLRAGEVSEAITTAQGTHILQVVERAGGRTKSFAEVQLQIQRKLSRDLEELTKLDYIERLMAGADIQRLPFPEETPLGVIPQASAPAESPTGEPAPTPPGGAAPSGVAPPAGSSGG